MNFALDTAVSMEANVNNHKSRFQAGFSVFESVVVTTLIGFMSLVSYPALDKSLHEYRLNQTAREIMANIQLARLKAVSNNFNYSFAFSPSAPNTYQVSGSEPLGPDNAFHPWNDANGNGTQDTDQVYSNPRRLPYGSLGTVGVSAFPNGSFVDDPPATITMTFLPDGRLNLTESATNYRCVVVQDMANQTQAVCVENSGMIRLFKYSDNAWIETK